MLNRVPEAITRSARLVTLNHPNSLDCDVSRKTVMRAPNATPPTLGENATIGGLGVISTEDEADYEYAPLGTPGSDDPQAKIQFTGGFSAPIGDVTDQKDGVTYAEAPIEALIECKLATDDPNYFTPKKNDIVTVFPGNGFVLAYEIVDLTSPTSIPPYVTRYLLQPRPDISTDLITINGEPMTLEGRQVFVQEE